MEMTGISLRVLSVRQSGTLNHPRSAYDASRFHVSKIGDDLKANSIYTVAAKTFGVKVQKAIDPEVAALLDDDDDLSRFGSNVEDLEEDFVVQANLPEEGEEKNLNEEHK
ncbi:Low temperature viability protein, partial [Thalictrum thalictroides]